MLGVSFIKSLCRNIFARRRVERDLDEELKSYIELATQSKTRQGLTEADARRAVLVELQGAEQTKERIREQRAGYRFEILLQDLRFAIRSLAKAPVFTLTVIAVLALGIGSTTLMFGIVDSVLLQGPPFPQPERIVTLWNRIPEEPRISFSPKEFTAWSKQTTVFEALSFITGTGFTLSGQGDPEVIMGRMITPTLFDVLGVKPMLGRTFTDAEKGERVVIVSHAFWRYKLQGKNDAIGQTITLNGELYSVVGIMPANFLFDGTDANLFAPADLDSPIYSQHPDAHFLRVFGRLKPGVTRSQLDAEVQLLGPRVDDPNDGTKRNFYSLSYQELTTGELRRPLLVLFCAVALLLLLACANVANLVLARTNARQPEMMLRAALGASRSRLMGQLLTESSLLAILGGLAGTGMAIWAIDLLRTFGGQQIPELILAKVNGPVWLFACATSGLTAVLFGMIPAWSASRFSYRNALQGMTRSTAVAERTRQALVVAEIAIAAVMLVCCALMVRSFVALIRVDPGFRPANVVTAEVFLAKERYPNASRMVDFYRRSLDQIRNLPGIESVGTVTHLPFGGNSWGNSFDVEGYTPPAGAQSSAQIRPVSPNYFRALGIQLIQGRDFTDADRETAPPVAVVNELFVKKFWPDESPMGKRIRYFGDWVSIVGVCGNIKHSRLDAQSDMEIYIPYPQVSGEALQFVGRDLNYVVRSSVGSAAAAELRNVIRRLDPQAVVKLNTLDSLIHQSTAQPRFRTWLVTIFSASAVVLACLGIYGVIAYLVTQRYKEIGIRMALGATRRNIFQLILGRTAVLTAAGVVIGLIVALFLSRFLASILYGISVHDVTTFIGVPICLMIVALLAAYLPARRAAQIDPVRSLHYE